MISFDFFNILHVSQMCDLHIKYIYIYFGEHSFREKNLQKKMMYVRDSESEV